jgi:signal transduction histidine kinase
LLYQPLIVHISKRIEAEKVAEKASRAKSDFLSRMSHELRTPMTTILGYAELLELQKDDWGDRASTCVEEIQSAGWHLLTLIDEVLDISQIEAGTIKLNLEPVDITVVMKDCLSMIRPLAKERDIQLNTEVETFEKQIVSGDKTRIKEVLVNILSNAVKYNSESGKITINYERKNDNKIQVSVTDTGRGISEDDQKVLFFPFTRLEDHNHDVQGIGIGLSISKHLIELMDGSIGVTSKIGKGSTFWIDLPLYQD